MTERAHWDDVYARRSPESLSWFQAQAALSLELIERMQLQRDAPILDVGAGASTLVDGLLARGYSDITLLDISDQALEVTRRRIEPRVVTTVVENVIAWKPLRRYAVWHDRAVFHFLTDEAERIAYRKTLSDALAERAHVVIATFALDGPERCSGLPVQRYSVEQLSDEFSDQLRLLSARREKHITPAGGEQPFVYAHFVKR